MVSSIGSSTAVVCRWQNMLHFITAAFVSILFSDAALPFSFFFWQANVQQLKNPKWFVDNLCCETHYTSTTWYFHCNRNACLQQSDHKQISFHMLMTIWWSGQQQRRQYVYSYARFDWGMLDMGQWLSPLWHRHSIELIGIVHEVLFIIIYHSFVLRCGSFDTCSRWVSENTMDTSHHQIRNSSQNQNRK